mgnify:FL=1
MLLGFEAEEESPIVFLRLFKQVRKRSMKVTAVAPFTTRANQKLKAQVIKTTAGNEANEIINIAGLTNKSVILVGERLAESQGALSAAMKIAQSSGAHLAWIPRRAGERGALEAGSIGTLLPGGRPVTDSAARVDIQSAWGVSSLPTTVGHSTSEILDALHTGDIDSLLIGGVDPLDISRDAAKGLEKAFVVSLEIRKSQITELANVVLPVAAVAEKSGTFINWEGRARSFEAAIDAPNLRSDVRILSMLADEMRTPINLPTVEAAAREMNSLGVWDGARVTFTPANAGSISGETILSSWRLLLDAGLLQDGEVNLAKTAHPSVAVISADRAKKLGVTHGDQVTISSKVGAITLPVEIADIDSKTVWIPRNSQSSRAIALLGAASGIEVSVVKA